VLMGAVGAIPGGMLADRIRRTRLLQVAIVAWSAALLAGSVAPSFGVLLATRVALGVVVAAAGPSIASLTGDFFAAGERARVYGFILAGEMIGGAFGFLVSGEVAALASWRVSFAVLALPGIALAWALHRWLPEPARGGASRLPEASTRLRPADGRDEPAHASNGLAQAQVERSAVDACPERVIDVRRAVRSTGDAVRYVLSIPANRMLIVSSSLGYFFLMGLQTFAVVYVKSHFGVGQGGATGLLALIVVFSIAGAVAGGRLADRLLRRGRVTARILVPALAYLFAAAVFGPAFSVGSLAIAAPLFMAGALALAATNPPLDAARLDIVPSPLWGRAEGVRTVFRSVAQALAPLSFGIVSEQLGSASGRAGSASGFASSAGGLESTLLIMLAVLVLSGAVMIRARRTYPSDVATALASDRKSRPAPTPERERDSAAA
jgi:MFS family permease